MGRKAAAGLLEAKGGWTRCAAQFALSGTDADVHAWIDTDRAIAQGQDDRETALYLAQVSVPAVAEAAQLALDSDDEQAIGEFLTNGMTAADADDYRVQLSRILADDLGKAVKDAANAALDANTPQALKNFFDQALAEAVREDDGVTIATLLTNGGPYTKATASVALEGPTWMRRQFIEVVQHKTAQLDHDFAAHIAAIRGAIAAAAKTAAKAREDAALASKAAAEAQEAAEEAADWAAKAQTSAQEAADHAEEARANADAADASASAAQASADQAKTAATTARSAARAAYYSANKATDAAHAALSSSYRAQAAATSARKSALAAGQDAAAAAAAATEARQIEADLRRQKMVEKAQQAHADAMHAVENNVNPADSPIHDKVNTDGSNGDNEEEPWYSDAAWWADFSNGLSVQLGFAAAIAGGASAISLACGAFPAAALFADVAVVLGGLSLVAGAVGLVATGIEHDFDSGEFASAAAGYLVALGALGAGKAVRGLYNHDITRKVSDAAYDLVSPLFSIFD
ncbi:ALF repeat-containing protein [Streptomyces sp. TR06-5]|uniref:ALF repeat-containing protein n=1 Tax=Streptomyces sp. TR06-5 TaxID=3385976 RepID=UPI00399F092B